MTKRGLLTTNKKTWHESRQVTLSWKNLSSEEITERVEAIKEMNRKGYTLKQVCKEYFITIRILKDFIKRHGITWEHYSKRLSLEQIEKIHELRARGFTIQEISKQLKICNLTVRKYTSKFAPCYFNGVPSGPLKLPDDMENDLMIIAEKKGMPVRELKLQILGEYIADWQYKHKAIQVN